MYYIDQDPRQLAPESKARPALYKHNRQVLKRGFGHFANPLTDHRIQANTFEDGVEALYAIVFRDFRHRLATMVHSPDYAGDPTQILATMLRQTDEEGWNPLEIAVRNFGGSDGGFSVYIEKQFHRIVKEVLNAINQVGV